MRYVLFLNGIWDALVNVRTLFQFWLFINDRNAWSENTFGTIEERDHVGPLKHLAKEAQEAIEATDPDEISEEVADCLFLTLDAAHRAGMSFGDLVRAAQRKLVINQNRTWPKPIPGGSEPVEHVRS